MYHDCAMGLGRTIRVVVVVYMEQGQLLVIMGILDKHLSKVVLGFSFQVKNAGQPQSRSHLPTTCTPHAHPTTRGPDYETLGMQRIVYASNLNRSSISPARTVRFPRPTARHATRVPKSSYLVTTCKAGAHVHPTISVAGLVGDLRTRWGAWNVATK